METINMVDSRTQCEECQAADRGIMVDMFARINGSNLIMCLPCCVELEEALPATGFNWINR
jgi:hypothetical protein